MLIKYKFLWSETIEFEQASQINHTPIQVFLNFVFAIAVCVNQSRIQNQIYIFAVF